MNKDLPDGWTLSTFGDVAEYINGRGFSKSEWEDEGRPIIRIQNLTGTGDTVNRYSGEVDEKHIIRDGDLLISWSATIGAHIYHGEEAALNQHIFKVNTRECINKKFLYYLTKSYVDELEKKAQGTGMKHITKGKFEESEIPLPPLPEQERIVAKIEELFSKLDSGVSELQKGTEQLKQYRLSLLKATFEGKLSKRARTQNGWEVAQDFEEHVDPPDILEIPSEWRWVEVGSVIESMRNGIYKPKEYYNDDGIASLRMYNIEDGRIVWKDIKRMELTDEELEKYRIEPGDLLVNRVNSRELVGKAAAIPEGLEECVFESKNIRVKPTEDLRGEYLGHWFYLFRKRHFMSQVKQTVGQATVTQTQIKEMPIPLAPIAEQDEILEKIERQESILSDIREQLDTNLTRAERLRQSILKDAFEGNLVPQDLTEEPPTPDGGDANLEPGEQTTFSEVTSDAE